MAQLIAIFKVVAVLAPLVQQLVRAAEETLPEGSSGKAKLALVRGWLEMAMSAQNDLGVAFTTIWPLLEATVTMVVTAYHETGVFKKKAA